MVDDPSAADSRSKHPIIEWAITAWRDALAAIQQMPTVLGIAFVAILVLNFLAFPFFQYEFGEPRSFGVEALSLILVMANGLLLTPSVIAVHRFVLLGERAASYRLELSSPRFRRFFIFTVAIELIIYGPVVLATLALDMSAHDPSEWIVPVTVFAQLALLAAGAVLVLRLLLLFPAIAVDAPGAKWSSALHDTGGHTWRMLLIVIVVGIPLWPVYAFVIYLQGPGEPVAVGAIISAVLDAVFTILFAAIYAALASRMFTAFADRLSAVADRSAPSSA